MNLDVLHGLDEPIQTLVRIIEKPRTRDDQLPLAVPHRPTYEPVVGIVRRIKSVSPAKTISCGDGAERLVLADTVKSSSLSESDDCHSFLLFNSDAPMLNGSGTATSCTFHVRTTTGIAERRTAHRVHPDRDEIHIRGGGQSVGIEEAAAR